MRNAKLKKAAVVIRKPFMALGAVGYVASLVVHLIALTKLTPVNNLFVMVLFAGAFAMIVPAGIRVNKVILGRGLIGPRKWRQRREALFGNIPTWLRWLLDLTGFYTVFNFVLVVILLGTRGDPQNLLMPRLMTGHFMYFYGYSFVVLYSGTLAPDSEDPDET
jgi:hypothetical protein